jgi:hypothetical protein
VALARNSPPTTIFPFGRGKNGRLVYRRTGRTTKNGLDGRQILNKTAIIIKMIKNVYPSNFVDFMPPVDSPLNTSGKHPAWKGERTGLFIRVPVEIAKDLRAEAQQTQQHFNDVAVNRLRTNGK